MCAYSRAPDDDGVTAMVLVARVVALMMLVPHGIAGSYLNCREFPRCAAPAGAFKKSTLASATRHRNKGGLVPVATGAVLCRAPDAKSADRVYRNKTRKRLPHGAAAARRDVVFLNGDTMEAIIRRIVE